MDERSAQTGDDYALKSIVRSFGWENYRTNPDDDLARPLVLASLSQGLDRQDGTLLEEQWMQIFNPAVRQSLRGLEDSSLSQPTKELGEVYRKFLDCLPKEHTARIEDGPPRLQTVLDAVRIAETKRLNNRASTKLGKAKRLFTKTNEHLTKYKDLCDLIPSGDKYICLIAGTLSAIVKATMNHEKIVESVSDAMDDLSSDIDDWKKLLELENYSDLSKEFVVQLYIEVFKFLVTVMRKWLSKSSAIRILRSFDSGFFRGEIEQKKIRIAELHKRLERQANRRTQRSIKEIQHSIGNMVTKEDLNRLRSQLQGTFIDLLGSERRLGNAVHKGLASQALSFKWEQRQAIAQTHTAESGDRSIGQCEVAAKEVQDRSRAEIYRAAAVRFSGSQRTHLYPAQEDVLDRLTRARSPTMHIETFNRIKQWNARSASQTLWVSGAAFVPKPSEYTRLSAHVVSTAKKAGVPVVYYFCDNTTRRVDITYSLIGQLVQLLPDEFESSVDLSSDRFTPLDGEESSCENALSLLEDLLMLGPPLLFVVVDGIQMMSSRAAEDVVQALRHSGLEQTASTDRRVNILFVTDGLAPALTSLSVHERLDATNFGRGYGEPGAGGVETTFL